MTANQQVTTDTRWVARPSADHSRSPLRTVAPVLLVVLASGSFSAWIGLRVGGGTATLYFDDIATALAALIATALCIRASLRQVGRLKLFWALMGSACGAWTLAEVLWAVYGLVLRVAVPVPSWADVGYLSAIPLAAAALLSHPAIRDGRDKQTGSTLDGLMVATALLYLSWSLVLGPLWHSSDLSTLGGVVAVAYPFGDVVILFLIIRVMRTIAPGHRLALSFVLLGLIALALSDSTYTYLVEGSHYTTGNPVDVGWVIGYLCLALGAYFTDRPAQARTTFDDDLGTSPLTSLIVPYLTVLAALIAISFEIELGRRLDKIDWFIAVALALLVIARHALFFLDRGISAGRDAHASDTRRDFVSPLGSENIQPAKLQ